MPQIPDIKLFNKGMNKDSDPRFLGQGEYIDALNVMTSNYQDGAALSLTNFPSIHRLSTLGYTILGMFKDEHEDKLYIFASNGTTGAIYSYTLSTDVLATILTTTVLPWDTSTIIKSANITEGIIIWTDGENEIGMYDQNITYGTLTADMLTLAQVVPLEEPSIQMVGDTSYKSNNVAGKFLQFKYRFVFKNKMRSVFSPISNLAYSDNDYASPNFLAGSENSINSVDIIMSGDDANNLVEYIEIAARSGNSGDFFMIKKLEANATFLSGGTQTYRFFNEGLYDPIALDESNQIMDDVPKKGATLEFANNRVVIGDVTTGYDKIDVDYDLEVIYGDSVEPTTQYALSPDRTTLEDGVAWAGNIANGDDLETYFGTGGGSGFNYDTLKSGDVIRAVGFSTGATWLYPFGDVTVTVQSTDTWATIANKLASPTFDHPYTPGAYLYGLLDTSGGDVGNQRFEFYLQQGQHVKTFKSGAWYNVGLQYEDNYGRTNGVQIQEDAKVYIKTLGERGLTPGSYAGAGAAKIKVTINNAMPSWATSVKVVYSRASVYDQSIQTATRGAAAESGSTTNVAIDIGCIEEWNTEKGAQVAYQWERGDKIRILTGNNTAVSILTDWSQKMLEAEIVGASSSGGLTTDGYNISIPSLDGLNQAETILLLSTGALIEIFRPSRELDASQSIYTEANFADGTTDTINGDAYLKSREEFPYGISTSTANIIFEGYNISDFIDSEHYDKGRATAIINQEESRKFATLMYSEVIIPNTDINKLNKFYPDVNFEEYNKSFGSIVHIYNEGDHLLMLQEDKVSKVFVDKSVMYDGSGNNQLLNTRETVLSSAVPYAGVYGIQDYRSFQAIGNRRYWLDMARGVVIRLSTNGIEEISRYGMRGWFSDICRTRMEAGELITYGAYDVQNDMYMIYFGTGNTVVFDEKNNAWITFTDVIVPAFSTYLNNRSFIIYTNYLWEMNYSGFKNTQHVTGVETAKVSTIKFPSNIEPTELKNYLAIHLDSTHAMAVTITTDALNGNTIQSSTLLTTDFSEREQEWHASFLRDINTPKLDPLMSAGDWTARAIFLGDTLKGKHANITLSLQTDDDLLIRMVKVLVSKG